MLCTGIILCFKCIFTNLYRTVIEHNSCQIVASLKRIFTYSLHTCRQRYHFEVTVVGKNVGVNIINMIRTDRIRHIQSLNAFSNTAANQFIGRIYNVSRSSVFSTYLRILYSQLILVLTDILRCIGIKDYITKCKAIVLSKIMQRRLAGSFKIKSTVNRLPR